MLKKFVKDIARYSVSQLLPAITAFITTPILTRLFPPAEYGNWALALSIASFLVALTASGLGSAVIRFYPASKANSTLNVFIASLFVSVSVITLVVAAIGFAILYIFKSSLPSELIGYIPLIILIFIAQSIFTVFMAILRASERSGEFSTFQLLQNYGGLGTGLLFVLVFHFRVDGLLWGTLITLIFILPFLGYLSTKGTDVHLSNFQMQEAVQMVEYAWPLTLGNVAMWGLRLSDLFIIQYFGTQRDVGLYTVSYNISAKSIELLVTLFLLSVSPLLMNVWEREGQKATEENLTMITRVYLVVCLPATVGLSVLALPFVQLLTAPEYYEGYKIFGFVALSSFIWGLANIAQMGMAVKKRTRKLGANQGIAAATHILLAVMFVPIFGYTVAAITTLIGYSVLLFLHTLASRPHLTWNFPFKTLLNSLTASGVMGIVVFWVYHFSAEDGSNSTLFLSASILIAVPVYFAALWLFGEIRQKEKDFIMQLAKRSSGVGK